MEEKPALAGDRGSGMRKITCINQGWTFQINDKKECEVTLPHTWNAKDGADGGNDYYRGTGVYTRTLARPDFDPDAQRVFLEFNGVNSSAKVYVNDRLAGEHHGGYSTFRFDVTELLGEESEIKVLADNSRNDSVYPQKADFTFYGGIYRDVNLIVASSDHFELEDFGAPGLMVTSQVSGEGARVRVFGALRLADPETLSDFQVFAELLGADGEPAASVCEPLAPYRGLDCAAVTDDAIRPQANAQFDVTLTIAQAHRWDGLFDPYLYRARCTLLHRDRPVDAVESRFGVREFSVDPNRGFFLNGRSYPLHGVSRHQDFKGLGNAIAKEQHDLDMALIKEIGANTVRLAHYQHDQYFYDLCDEAGMIVWAEIPYISEHMPNGRKNTVTQMQELIAQNYNHPSIVTWGISNEITISTKDKADMLDNHRMLNELCHTLDPGRPTVLACYAMCNPFAKVVHISDLVSYNLYLGWYVPGLFLNDWFMSLFHRRYPRRCLGYSEYGAEGMPNLHSERPRRGDNTEEYQAKYHEYMLECFKRHPFLWATHVWNMFDFAADARDQGGEPGMNHKGLVTYDRKIKKDSFYLYKCYWNTEPMVHICGKRFKERGSAKISVKVYSNEPQVELFVNGRSVGTKRAEHIFMFDVTLQDGENRIEARAGRLTDSAVFVRTDSPKLYKLKGKSKNSANWV